MTGPISRLYDFLPPRKLLGRRGIAHTIPERRDRRERRSERSGGRAPSFERSIYARRNAVGRCVNRLEQLRVV